MEKRRRCLGCGGEYSPELPDGARYFHVCPPEQSRGKRVEGDPPVEVETIEERRREGHRDEHLREILVRDDDGQIRERKVELASEGAGYETLDE